MRSYLVSLYSASNALDVYDHANDIVPSSYQALANLTTGSNNTASGYQSLSAITTANSNTGLGQRTCATVTSGANNLCAGFRPGSTTLTTGSFNILLGTSTATDTPTSSTSHFISIDQAMIGYSTAPTVSSGLGTSPTVAGGGTFAFVVTVGAAGTPTTTEVLTMPQAPTGWICSVNDQTTANTARQTANTTTSVTFTWSAAPTNSDVLLHRCAAY